MNDEPKLTAEQLAQATSRALPPDAALDAETAALREGFLRFGGAVEAAGGSFDEAALIARLTSTAPAGEIRPAGSTKAATNLWPLLLSAALAASALVAIVRTVSLWPAASDGIAVVTPSPAAPEQLSPVDLGPGAVAGPSQLAWSDPLDEEIASAQAAVERLGGPTADLDGSLQSFGSRLEALAAELESGSL